MMYHKPGVDLNTFHCLFTNTANSLSSAHAHQSNIMTVHVLANCETSSPREMFYSFVLYPLPGAMQGGSLLWINTSVDVINKTEMNLIIFTLHVMFSAWIRKLPRSYSSNANDLSHK